MHTNTMKYLAATALVITAPFAHTTPSGLNNIPTADTTPQGTFVIQGFTTLGNDRDADFNLGFKTGLDLKAVKFELGAAAHITPGKGGLFTAHAKVAVPLGEGLPTLALGVANISFDSGDRRRAGDEFFYAVVSLDLGFLRVHCGCASQDGEALPFFGFDKTFRTSGSATKGDGKSVKAVVTPKCDLSRCALMQSSSPQATGSTPPVCSCRCAKISTPKHGEIFPTTAAMPRSRSRSTLSSHFNP
jgi:hypothetical protein